VATKMLNYVVRNGGYGKRLYTVGLSEMLRLWRAIRHYQPYTNRPKLYRWLQTAASSIYGFTFKKRYILKVPYSRSNLSGVWRIAIQQAVLRLVDIPKDVKGYVIRNTVIIVIRRENMSELIHNHRLESACYDPDYRCTTCTAIQGVPKVGGSCLMQDNRFPDGQ